MRQSYLFVVHPGRRGGHRLVEPVTKEKNDFEIFTWEYVSFIVVDVTSEIGTEMCI